ncbi:phosphate/phosphite/phosphonate ABC transporter substrate-binding protein [Hydrogenophaga atypica]|uniref:Phosphate/phosphite/phosphonate ABC transporter substrate-binding protein n=1 Tax=Hydrogenophaga atypica TaxID=249409 RepID=A0ABW2QLY8_9BURK
MNRHRFHPPVAWTLALAAWLWPLFGHAQPACDDPHPLRMALIPKSQAQQQRLQLAPLLRVLERSTQRRVELSLPSSYAAVIEGLLAGTVDVAELGPASYAMLMARAEDVQVFAALAARDGTPPDQPGRYHALLLTNRDAGLDSVAQLQGKRVSLTDPASTSGALLPRAGMRQLTGRTLEQHFARVSYAGSHDRALQALRRGLVDAAFVSSTRLNEALQQGRLKAGDVVELWRSPPVPTDPFVVRKRLCAPLQAQIREAFLGHQAELAPMFQQLGSGAFVPADDADYRAVRDLLQQARP